VATGGAALAFNESARNKAEGVFNSVTGRPSQDDLRNQRYAINDQIKAYKDQTALSEKAIADAAAEKKVVKRQIQEKQIRALRGSYRAPSTNGGFLNSQSSGTPAPAAVGASPGLSNKLGTT
jgi:hypothetical protein